MNPRIALKVTGVLFMLAGMGLMYFFVRNTYRAYESHDWPTAQGVVLSSSVETYKDTKAQTRRRPRIEYEYDVPLSVTPGGEASPTKRFRSENIYVTGKYGNPTLTNSYPAGKKVEVHYDPRDFSRSYLLPEYGESFFPLIGGLFFAGIGFFLFYKSRTLASV